MKKLKALISILFSAALLTSCSLSLTENKTAIKLVLPKYINSSSARGVLQYQQYDKEDINYYDVFCTPILDDEYWQKLHDDIEKNYDFTQENGNENFEELIYKTNEEFQHRYAELKNVKPGETVTITELLEGKYQISVTGYTANGDYAAWGFSEEFDLIANETKTVEIKMTLSGNYIEVEDEINVPENAIKFSLTSSSDDSQNRCNISDFNYGVALIIKKNNFLKFQATVLKDINPYDPVSVKEFMDSLRTSDYVADYQQFYSIKYFTISTANLAVTTDTEQTPKEYYLYILGLSKERTICLQGNTLFTTENDSKECNLNYYFLTKHIPLTINFTGNIAEKLTPAVTEELVSLINPDSISRFIKIWDKDCNKLIQTYALPIDLQELITKHSMKIYLDSSAFTSGERYNVLLQVYYTIESEQELIEIGTAPIETGLTTAENESINYSSINSFVYNSEGNSVTLTLE